MDSLIENANGIIESILSDYEEGIEKDEARDVVMDIIVGSFFEKVEYKIEKLSAWDGNEPRTRTH